MATLHRAPGLSLTDKSPLLLVVDDETDITDTYAMFLGLHGYEVMTADNALHALELIAQRVPDLILSDCMMPFMDGVEFSRRVKADPATCRVPVILMSGAPNLHDLDSPHHQSFLRKPVPAQLLLREIGRLLA